MLINMNIDVSFLNEYGGLASYAYFTRIDKVEHRHASVIRRNISSLKMAHVYGIVSGLTVFLKRMSPPSETKIYINSSHEQAVEILQGRKRDMIFDEVLEFRNRCLAQNQISAFYRYIPASKNDPGLNGWCKAKSKNLLDQHIATLVT